MTYSENNSASPISIENESLISHELPNTPINIGYDEILQRNRIDFSMSGYYWQIGQITQTQGWILHLSVMIHQLTDLLNIIIPIFSECSLCFKIIRDEEFAIAMMDGALGYNNVGKMVIIYPENEIDAVGWAKNLLILTERFRGPHIPTDCHLGSIVYTTYGAIHPIIKIDDYGMQREYIYDTLGQLVIDPCSIPFQLPECVEWPFHEITSPLIPKKEKLLNYTYYPTNTLKLDAKGDVFRALYFKYILNIKSCLIKQGRFNMFGDKKGRNIQDRLQWQYDLHQQLSKDIPLPKVFDYFEQNGDRYLAMEFIKGISITKWVKARYQNRIWTDLPPKVKLELLDVLINIFEIILQFHEKGFIHRDITSENFLITRRKKIYLIDLELSWSLKTRQPDPPFGMGSPGFMSPEQIRLETPTVSEDIYGIAGLTIFFLTCTLPAKFEDQSSKKLNDQLYFYFKNQALADILTNCRHDNPKLRPGLSILQGLIKVFKETILLKSSKPSISEWHIPTRCDILQTTQAGLNGITSKNMVYEGKYWISLSQKIERKMGNEQMGTTIYPGWNVGISGPLWIISLAKKVGLPIDASIQMYHTNWEYIWREYFNGKKTITSGLYSGEAGIALALCEGMQSGLLVPDKKTINQIIICLSKSCKNLGLSDGRAGQGISILHASRWLKSDDTEHLLNNCVQDLLNSQQADGSWLTLSQSSKKKVILTGIDRGVSGILWFLLCSTEIKNDDNIQTAIDSGLAWLIKKGISKPGKKGLPVNKRKQISPWDVGEGILGSLLVLIKAYDKLNKRLYREIVEDHLLSILPRPIQIDLTMGSGLAGLGELYLEAFQAFDNVEWKKRAGWIADVLVHRFQTNSDSSGYWHPTSANIPTVDLFNGNSGILHFLLRYMFTNQIDHPLSFNNNIRVCPGFAAVETGTGSAENL